MKDKELISKEQSKKEASESLISLSLDLGFRIAVPIVIFGLLGRYLDRLLDTGILFLILGIVVSLAVSCFLIIFKIKKIFASLTNNSTSSGEDQKRTSQKNIN